MSNRSLVGGCAEAQQALGDVAEPFQVALHSGVGAVVPGLGALYTEGDDAYCVPSVVNL